MMDSRKICVVTGTRAEYGLLFWLLKEIKDTDDLQLQLIVTGMHLSPEFGLTYRQIEKDGFNIDHKVDIELSSDSEVSICKSIGLGVSGFAEAFEELQPDLLVVLGDRFEIFSAASAAMICKIPIAHIHGGELTEGLIDEAIRHSISKMSHLHFTSTNEYRNRVIQLGEQPERVFNVGAAGLDNIDRLNLMTRSDFEKSIDFKLGKYNLLITFHPVTLESKTSEYHFNALLQAIEELEETHLIFTKANADPSGRVINELIDNYVVKNSHKATAFSSLGQLRYLSALPYMDGVVGNSSSGLIEAPSFKVGTINIGDRQRGRIIAESVIDCGSSPEEIAQALQILFSNSFKAKLKIVENPYGTGGASKKIVDIIHRYSLEGILKKQFFDITSGTVK